MHTIAEWSTLLKQNIWMKCLHAFGINRHKCKADVSCLCQYTCNSGFPCAFIFLSVMLFKWLWISAVHSRVIQFTYLVYITSLDSQLLIWRRDNILLADFTRTEQLVCIYMNRWTTAEPRARLSARKTGLSPPVIYYWPFQGGASVVVYSNCQCTFAFCWSLLYC